MNWLQQLLKATAALPFVVAGIQHLAGEADGVSKKQLAMDSLGLAFASSQTWLNPQQQAQATAVANFAANAIDSLVETFHQINAPGFGMNQQMRTAAAPAPAPPMPPEIRTNSPR